jgi:AcrR family transcriptional regulator
MPKRKAIEPEPNLTAEERILRAATEEFAAHGFHGARTQAIADAAEVNKAMLHYYFRSKENLYTQVMKNAFRKVLMRLGRVWLEPGPVETKVEMVVDSYMDAYEENPGLLKIILREVEDGGKRLKRAVQELKANEFQTYGFNPPQILGKAAQELRIPPGKVIHFLVNIIGMCAISFIAPLMLQNLLDFEISDMKAFLKDRRQAIKAMVLASVETQKKRESGRSHP